MAIIRLSKELCVTLAFPELTGAAPLRVYCALRLHGKVAKPSIQTVARALGITPRTVELAQQKLVDAGLIARSGPPRKGIVPTWRFEDWSDDSLKRLALVLDNEKRGDFNRYRVGSLVPGNKTEHDIPSRGQRRALVWRQARQEYPHEETQKILEAAYRDSPELRRWASSTEGTAQLADLRKRYPAYLMARAQQRLALADFDSLGSPVAYLQTVLTDIEERPDLAVEGVWQEEDPEPPPRFAAGRGGRKRNTVSTGSPSNTQDDESESPEDEESQQAAVGHLFDDVGSRW